MIDSHRVESQTRPLLGTSVDRLVISCYFSPRSMIKKLLTTFLLLAAMANLFAIIPPHVDGEGGCSAECCASARQDTPESSWSALCCAVNCKQNAETSPAPASAISARQQQKLAPVQFISSLATAIYIQQTQFPSSPTRHLAGSSTRYLDNNTFLI